MSINSTSSMSACKRLLVTAAAAVFALAAALPAISQTSAVGNITGTVTDASGAAVSGATVVILNNDTGATRSVTTGGSGDFSSAFLQPGHYEIIFSGPG